MPRPARPTSDRNGVPHIYQQLRRTLRYGTDPAQLVIYSRTFIDLLAPANRDAEEPIEDRAVAAEKFLRHAVRRIGGDNAQALYIFFGLAPGYVKTPIEHRRKAAARKLGIQPDTFRRPRHEHALLLHVAMEIYRRQGTVNPARI